MAGILVYAASTLAPAPYVVHVDYTTLEVVEVLNPDGERVEKTPEQLRREGRPYTTVWVAPSTMKWVT